MDKKVIQKSVFLVGPAGCGKSLHSRALSEKTGLPVINLDTMRHCPKSLEFLESESDRLDAAIRANGVLLDKSVGIEKKELQEKRNRLLSAYAKVAEQTRLRKLLPNLPNYNDIELTIHSGNDAGKYRLAFNETMVEGVRHIAKSHGLDPNIAWHNYQKPFEIALAQNLIEQIDFPAVIDFGGGMTISLEREYNKQEQKALDLGVSEEAYREVMPFEGETLTQEVLYTFGQLPKNQIVYFKAPEDLYSNPDKYKECKGMERLMADGLNPKFIETGMYEEFADMVVPVQSALGGKEVDLEAVAKNCDNIISQTNLQVKAQDVGQNK